MVSDCDNCIHTYYTDNEWYCIIGNRPSKECEDYRHWNRLSDEEKRQMTNETDEKDKIIKDLEAEDKRLCNIISSLHTEMGIYNDKIKKQEQVINTQQDIINKLTELIGLIR